VALPHFRRVGGSPGLGTGRSAPVESLRAIAALAIVVFHACGSFGIPPGDDTIVRRLVLTGSFGVDLFFVLSGCLIFAPFVGTALGESDHPSLARYARHRVMRVVPLYVVVLAVVLIAQDGGGTPTVWWHFLTFTQDFSHRTINTVDGPMWSLGVEVDFYLLLPVLALGLGRITRGSVGRLVVCLLALGAVSFAVQIIKVQSPAHPSLLWSLSLPATFFYFVWGMLLAILRRAWRRSPGGLRGPLTWSDLWLAAAVALWVAPIFSYRAGLICAPLASVLAIGACLLPLRPGWGLRVLRWRPLVVLGLSSYGIYLWNYPVITRLFEHGFPVASSRLIVGSLIVCGALALVTYALVEAPAFRLRDARLLGGAPSRPAADPPAPAMPAAAVVTTASAVPDPPVR
jgi:peptidoglycan/LPS O-acetylase OafA/YrhL